MRRLMIVLTLFLGACGAEDPTSPAPDPQPTASGAAGAAGAPVATGGHGGESNAAGASGGATAAAAGAGGHAGAAGAGMGGAAGYPPPIMYVPPPPPPPPPPPAKFDLGMQCVEAASCASGFCWAEGPVLATKTCRAAARPTMAECNAQPCLRAPEGCGYPQFSCIDGALHVTCAVAEDCAVSGIGGTCAAVGPRESIGVCSPP